MLTLWTGTPGAGKTAAMVSELKKVADGGRAIYVVAAPDGKGPSVEGLTIPHEVVDGRRWHIDVPDGALIVIDEVQHHWRPRGPSQAVPEHIAALETHRHKGIDFYLTTQQPKLVDGNVRALVGRHVHLRDTGWLGRWEYEWPECSENLAWRTCQQKRKYKLPKAAFELYKSASVHIKPQRGRSPWIVLGVGALACAAVVTWAVTRSVSSRGPTPAPAPAAASAPLQHTTPAATRLAQPQTAREIVEAFKARLPERPETAAAYDHLRVVTVMPRIVGGWCVVGGACRCYTQQGTDPNITPQACAQWIAQPPFDPYRVERRDDRRDRPEPAPQPQPPQQPPLVAALGG